MKDSFPMMSKDPFSGSIPGGEYGELRGLDFCEQTGLVLTDNEPPEAPYQRLTSSKVNKAGPKKNGSVSSRFSLSTDLD